MSQIPRHRILYEPNPTRLLPVRWVGDSATLPAGWTVDDGPYDTGPGPWGNCPVQAEGDAPGGLRWYFRARWGPWTFDVGADPVAGQMEWWCIGPPAEYTGWMENEDAWQAILDCIHGRHEQRHRTPEAEALIDEALEGLVEEMRRPVIPTLALPPLEPEPDMSALAEWIRDHLGTGR